MIGHADAQAKFESICAELFDKTMVPVDKGIRDSQVSKSEIDEVDLLVMDSVDVLLTFIEDKEIAIKKASERRIIDVV